MANFIQGFDTTSKNKTNNVTKVEPIVISPKGRKRTVKQRRRMSNAKKAYYRTEEGKKRKEDQSKKMTAYYRTEDGQFLKQKLRELNKGKNRSKLSASEKEDVIESFSLGLSISQIAAYYGISRTSIYRCLKAKGSIKRGHS